MDINHTDITFSPETVQACKLTECFSYINSAKASLNQMHYIKPDDFEVAIELHSLIDHAFATLDEAHKALARNLKQFKD